MNDAPNQRQPLTRSQNFVCWALAIGSWSVTFGLVLLLGLGGWFLAIAIIAYLAALIICLDPSIYATQGDER